MTGPVHLDEIGSWESSWLWGMPLIVLTVVMHVIGLALIRAGFGLAFRNHPVGKGLSVLRFASAMGVTMALVTGLHVLQAAAWATAYVLLGALPGPRQAMLYSIGAMTTYGHAAIYLRPEWQMLGALQALNGVMLFGLSTAFLYGMIQRAWPPRSQA
jgi:hypothetical protein